MRKYEGQITHQTTHGNTMKVAFQDVRDIGMVWSLKSINRFFGIFHLALTDCDTRDSWEQRRNDNYARNDTGDGFLMCAMETPVSQSRSPLKRYLRAHTGGGDRALWRCLSAGSI